MKTSKTVRELVCFFYAWKRTPRYKPAYAVYCQTFRQSKVVKDMKTFVQSSILSTMPSAAGQDEEAADEEQMPAEPLETAGPCLHCLTEVSESWNMAPLSINANFQVKKVSESTNLAICSTCATNAGLFG